MMPTLIYILVSTDSAFRGERSGGDASPGKAGDERVTKTYGLSRSTEKPSDPDVRPAGPVGTIRKGIASQPNGDGDRAGLGVRVRRRARHLLTPATAAVVVWVVG